MSEVKVSCDFNHVSRDTREVSCEPVRYRTISITYCVILTRFHAIPIMYQTISTTYRVILARYHVILVRYQTISTMYRVILARYKMILNRYQVPGIRPLKEGSNPPKCSQRVRLVADNYQVV
uniref:Uncharacterized protein n=1 Tax=Oryza glumipatula TaxID=40148 RepID=A0A0E0AUN4_9ORYZ